MHALLEAEFKPARVRLRLIGELDARAEILRCRRIQHVLDPQCRKSRTHPGQEDATEGRAVSELAIVVRIDPVSEGSADIGVVGPITRATARGLREAVRDAVRGASRPDPARPCPRLRLDLTGCTDVDVDGLLALAVAQQVARAQGGDLYLEHVPALIERQVRQHNFESLLRDPHHGDPWDPIRIDRTPGRLKPPSG